MRVCIVKLYLPHEITVRTWAVKPVHSRNTEDLQENSALRQRKAAKYSSHSVSLEKKSQQTSRDAIANGSRTGIQGRHWIRKELGWIRMPFHGETYWLKEISASHAEFCCAQRGREGQTRSRGAGKQS
jgi:hypothetical protein